MLILAPLFMLLSLCVLVSESVVMSLPLCVLLSASVRLLLLLCMLILAPLFMLLSLCVLISASVVMSLPLCMLLSASVLMLLSLCMLISICLRCCQRRFLRTVFGSEPLTSDVPWTVCTAHCTTAQRSKSSEISRIYHFALSFCLFYSFSILHDDFADLSNLSPL